MFDVRFTNKPAIISEMLLIKSDRFDSGCSGSEKEELFVGLLFAVLLVSLEWVVLVKTGVEFPEWFVVGTDAKTNIPKNKIIITEKRAEKKDGLSLDALLIPNIPE